MTSGARAAAVLFGLVTGFIMLADGAGQQGKPAVRSFIRPTTPRIRPVPVSEWTEAQRQALGRFARGEQTTDAFKTCLHNVELCRVWVPLLTHTVSGSTLPRRDLELLVLRTAWLCHDDFVWSDHELAARRGKVLTDEEILRVAKDPTSSNWSGFEMALLRAADELHADQFIQENTWKTLTERYDERQLLDLIFAVGQYTMVSMYLNSVGIELMPGYAGLPK